ncbi:LppP/LprE family lipoprotein [Nocardia sp. NBC_00511]|uniref:LppP/LprE family lipoprotein n=1 Tax=Nocardia sp. NBC_00511 TaxID=2903591 RepID=UPI0030E0810E
MNMKALAAVALAAGIALTTGGCAASTSKAAPSPVGSVAQQQAAPNGSGNGLCFDRNSSLAQAAIARLAAPPVGGWSVGEVSDDSLSSGCDGVLSWMTVNTSTNHTYTHVLFFTNGTYLGTATSDAYPYTLVGAHTRTSLALTYRWTNATDPMCCPQGGPSTVTFTLNGTTVTANGQFPPHS